MRASSHARIMWPWMQYNPAGPHIQRNLELVTNPKEQSALSRRAVEIADDRLGLDTAAVAAEARRSVPRAQRAKENLSLALPSVRLGMLSLYSAGAANLGAGHMATLVVVSPDSSVLYTEYVPEPLIAVTAFNGMVHEGRIGELLGSVGNLLASGAVSAIFTTGDADEFTVSFMLVQACSHQPLCNNKLPACPHPRRPRHLQNILPLGRQSASIPDICRPCAPHGARRTSFAHSRVRCNLHAPSL